MATIRNSVEIRCPREVAFSYLSDLRSELEWNPACQQMKKLTAGPVGLGTRFRGKWRGGPVVEIEIRAFEPPLTWTAHNGGPVEVDFTCRLEPTPTGTRLDAEFVARPHGWFRLVFPMFLVVIKRQERANMRHLRTRLESLSQEA
jgi:uncharacterized protein YndB with AHSA1/START domain